MNKEEFQEGRFSAYIKFWIMVPESMGWEIAPVQGFQSISGERSELKLKAGITEESFKESLRQIGRETAEKINDLFE